MKKIIKEKQLVVFGKKYINDYDLGAKLRLFLFKLDDYYKGKSKVKPKLE